MSTDPTAVPPWSREGSAQTIKDDPEAYAPGSSPIARPIWSDWSLHPPNADGKGGVKT